MIPFKLDMARIALDDWGSPEDIGAQTLQGPIRVAGRALYGKLDAPVCAGLYSATRGRYRVVYPFDEHATMLDGEVALTDETTGSTVVFGPGDSWVIVQGTPIIWEIRSESARKSFIAVTRPVS